MINRVVPRRMPKSFSRLLALFSLLVFCSALLVPVGFSAGVNGAGKPLVFRNVRIFDGAGTTDGGTVIVNDGKIVAVGKGLPIPDGAEIVDGAGDTLLPGLIDSHTHAYLDALEQALRFGVTTELDMFTDYHYAAETRKAQAEGKHLDRADLFSAATLVTAPKGHGTEYGIDIPTIKGPDEAQAFVDARIAEGSDYIKIIYDDGSAYGLKIPTISKETMAAVVAAAHKRHKLAVVHIATLQGARDAIDAGADGLAHLFIDRAPDPEFGRFAAAHHVFVIATLTVLEGIAGIHGGATLITDPWLGPYILQAEEAGLTSGFPLRPGITYDYPGAEEAIRQLKAAHVPILAGTDSGNPGTMHGASLHRELELLVHAGLTPSEALAAATSVPAAQFHLPDRGRISVGLRADLLLVKGDPTVDIKATRNIVGVWKLGVRLDREPYRARVEQERAGSRHSHQTAPPAGPESGLVSDFDGDTPTAQFGLGWMVTTDSVAGGKSVAQFRLVPGGANGSKGSLEITGEIKPPFAYPWAGAIFFPGAQPMTPVNLFSKKKISFWAKGDGKQYRIMIFGQSHGYIPASLTFEAGPQWKEYTFPLTSFGMDGHDVTGIAFAGGPGEGSFEFQIDEVRLEQ
ncbi:MAG TPA: amidohydrolase family protein [Blastocatellia bacterium]|nr:amidohydrolase family protein [Blastocatellia bacterium]